VVNFSFLCAGVAIICGGYFLLRWLAEYTVVTIYEVTDDMVPVDRELLADIAGSHERAKERATSCDERRQVRLDLASIRNQLRQMLINARRSRHWAFSDRRIILKNKLECSSDTSTATDRVLNAERELRRLTLWVLFRVWLWSLSNFHAFEHGPVPDIRKLNLSRVVHLYENVRLAAINLARCYGEAVVAEDINMAM
jgi:hypothetical protein